MATWQRLDAASETEARELLTMCCGSPAWVDRMLAHRPFGSDEQLHAMARQEWFALTPDLWKDAFAQHPAIGDREALRERFPKTAEFSADEQRGVADASDHTLDALAERNRDYRARFGHIFIVCATGKSADELLASLDARLKNDPQTELLIAAGEQAKIIELRLQRLA